MSSSELREHNGALATHLEALIASDRTGDVSASELQSLLSAAIRFYSAKAEREGYFPAVPRGAITATDAMITATALLKAVNVAVFELGLWQSWAQEG